MNGLILRYAVYFIGLFLWVNSTVKLPSKMFPLTKEVFQNQQIEYSMAYSFYYYDNLSSIKSLTETLKIINNNKVNPYVRIFLIDSSIYKDYKNGHYELTPEFYKTLRKITSKKENGLALRIYALESINDLSQKDSTFLKNIVGNNSENPSLKAAALKRWFSIDKIGATKTALSWLREGEKRDYIELNAALYGLCDYLYEKKQNLLKKNQSSWKYEQEKKRIINAMVNFAIRGNHVNIKHYGYNWPENVILSLGSIQDIYGVYGIVKLSKHVAHPELLYYVTDENFHILQGMLLSSNVMENTIALQMIEKAPIRDFSKTLIELQKSPFSYIRNKSIKLLVKTENSTYSHQPKWGGE